MPAEVVALLIVLSGIIYFIFVRINEKKDEKFEKRKW
jgi:hypothetical protein